MTLRDFIGVLSGADNDRPLPKGLSGVACDDFQVVLAGKPRAQLLRASRKRLLRAASNRQQVLEHLMLYGTVLPALPGMALKSDEAEDFVAANRAILDPLRKRLAGAVQFQVTVGWNKVEAASRFNATQPQALADDWCARFATILDAVAIEQIRLPATHEVSFNAVVRIMAQDEPRLDTAVSQIDALWPDGLRVRQIGPSPAVSFGSLGVRRVSPAQVRAARAVLGIDGAVAEAEVDQARHSALKTARSADWAMIKKAADVLRACARAGGQRPPPLAYVWEEGRAEVAKDLEKVA